MVRLLSPYQVRGRNDIYRLSLRMRSIPIYRNTRRAWQPLLLFAIIYQVSAIPQVIYAQATFLTESEVVEFCIEAILGKKPAQKKIIEEYRKYESLIQNKAPFIPVQKELYDEIVETIQIFAPQILPRIEKKEKRKIIVKKPERGTQAIEPKEQKILQWKEDADKFFPFEAGTVMVYTGRSKKIFEEEWFANGKTLKSVVLNTKEWKDGKREALLFQEVLTQQEQYVAEQSLERFVLSPEGVRIQREVVLNQPFPGKYLPVGKQESYRIASLPLQEGARVGGYSVVSISTTLPPPLKEFQGVLVLSGIIENFSFVPDFGLVKREIYDEQWILRERLKPATAEKNLEPKEQSALLRQIKKFCRKQGLKFKSLLSSTLLEGEGSELSMQALVRLLVFRRDSNDPDQKKYQILKQHWGKSREGKKSEWRLLPASVGGEGDSPR